MRRYAFAILILFCAGAVNSQRFTVKHYGKENGLDNFDTRRIGPGQKGFLWVGTENGLYRYDGSRFSRFGPDDGLQRADIGSLAVAPDGKLWASGTPGGIAYLAGSRFIPVKSQMPLEIGSPGHLAIDKTGAVYASTAQGLAKIVSVGAAIDVRQLSSSPANGIAIDRKGVVWFGCDTDLCILDEKGIHRSGYSGSDCHSNGGSPSSKTPRETSGFAAPIGFVSLPLPRVPSQGATLGCLPAARELRRSLWIRFMD